MRIFSRVTSALLIAFMIIGLCGCKDKPDDISSSHKGESITANKEVEDALDPENTEENTAEGSEAYAGEIEKKQSLAYGIDVSKWQGKIDWKKVAADSVDFAIVRIGYRAENGSIYKDSNADYNIQQAIKSGLLVGVYFFSTAISSEEAKAEAGWVKSQIAGYKISYPVVYDCEGYTDPESRMYNLSAAQRTDNAIVFLDAVKASGYDGMFYGDKSALENTALWETSRIAKSYKIWVAHYSTPTYPQTERPDYSGRYDMWQYTNRGNVSGVNGNCDMIVSYFKANEAAAKDNTQKVENAKPPKTEEELLYTDASDSVTAKQEVNLREGPSTKYSVVGVLKSGEFLKRTGIGKNGWSRLIYGGKTVYAITSYLSTEVVKLPEKDIVNGMEFSAKADRVTAKVEVNLRSLPSTGASVVGVLKAGEFLNRTAISSNGWSRLTFNGQTVYAVTNYLTDTVPETNKPQTDVITEYGMEFTPVSVNVTAKEEVNLRDKPSSSGTNVVHTLKNGEYVQKVGESKTGWARLIYNGQTVYAISSFLTQ